MRKLEKQEKILRKKNKGKRNRKRNKREVIYEECV